jgi:hypothetical protein
MSNEPQFTDSQISEICENFKDIELKKNNEINSIQHKNLNLKNIPYPNLKIIKTIGNGDCLFHSVLSATNEEYVNSKDKDKEKKGQEFRNYLAEKLILMYPKLSRGNLEELSKDVPEYKLENMLKTLKSYRSVNNLFNELISETLNIDIYLVYSETSDVYIMGDEEIYHKNRPSIVIYYTGNHYELIGVEEKNGIVDFYQYDHPFIKLIKNRIKELKAHKKPLIVKSKEF